MLCLNDLTEGIELASIELGNEVEVGATYISPKIISLKFDIEVPNELLHNEMFIGSFRDAGYKEELTISKKSDNVIWAYLTN